MEPDIKTEVREITNELSGIIRELENIAYGMEKDFRGIGNESCAACINRVSDSYQSAKRRINDAVALANPDFTNAGGGGFR